MRQVGWAKAAGVAVLVGVGVLYLLTLDNGLRPGELAGGDLITHQYAQAQARFANAPGYPLYTLLGWVWFTVGRALLGWAFNPTAILSLYSTWWAMAALAVLYALVLKVSRGNWLLSAWAVAFYAVTPLFWYYAVSSEQYASAVFQTLLLVWLAFRWEEDRRDRLLAVDGPGGGNVPGQPGHRGLCRAGHTDLHPLELPARCDPIPPHPAGRGAGSAAPADLRLRLSAGGAASGLAGSERMAEHVVLVRGVSHRPPGPLRDDLVAAAHQQRLSPRSPGRAHPGRCCCWAWPAGLCWAGRRRLCSTSPRRSTSRSATSTASATGTR